MKKGLGILVAVIAVVVLIVSGVAAANPDKAADVAKEKAPNLEKIDFIHWKKGFAKPPCNNNGICDPGENPSCPDCKNGGNGDEEPDPTATCYAFLGKYGKTLLKWKELPVRYTINPTNSDGLEELFITDAISAGAEEWDSWTDAELFNDLYGIDYTAIWGVQDYKNAITWDDYPTEGVIAVCRVWYNPATKAIVEFDVMFDTDWTWGDAEATETTDPNDSTAVMDLQNIATHELGHGAGLDDVYEAECSEVTMYGRSNYEETQKRDLETPDITGIQELY